MKTSLLLIQVHLVHYVWSMVAPPSHVTMDSINMRHVLRWSPPPTACKTPFRYSVQFQGEFEVTVRNGAWVDSPECQDVTRTYCDQTSDLGSNSNYSIRVRARCVSQTSAWAQLSPAFNRRHTKLTVPQMTLSTVGDALLVSFEQAPPTASIEVEVRKNASSPPAQARVFVIPAEEKEKLLHVAGLQDSRLYCVRARVLVDQQLRSQHTREQCVRVTGPHAPWKTPTTAVLTLLVMVGVTLAAFWAVVQCRTRRYCRSIHKEALPHSLLPDRAASAVMSEPEQEVCAQVWLVPKEPRLQAAGPRLQAAPRRCPHAQHAHRPWPHIARLSGKPSYGHRTTEEPNTAIK